MSERAAGSAPDTLPRPTPRQLVIRSIGTAVVVGGLVAVLLLVLDARNEPTDVTDLAEEPRTVAYNQLALQIPADWTDLADVDDCGHVQGDTLMLGLSGVVTCDEGQRNPEATDVVISSLSGTMAAPAPQVRLRPVTLPSGLRGMRGSTLVREPPPEDGAAGSEGEDSDEESDDPPLRTTVLQIPALDAQVVATSPDRSLVRGILNSAKPVPSGSPSTLTAAYLFGALDIPRTWRVNAVACGQPVADTLVLGHLRQPGLTRPSGENCPTARPAGVTDITLEALDSAYGSRWGVLATEPVTLLDGVKGLRGSRTLANGQTLTVVLVPNLRVLAVARSSDQALVDTVLSTMHRAVPTPPSRDEPTPTTTPEPTARPTLPAGVQTRTVRHLDVALAVPSRWSTADVRCGMPQSDTVVLGAPTTDGPGCPATRPDGVSELVIDRLYSGYGSLWQGVADQPVTLPSGLSGLRGTTTSAGGLRVTVMAFPTIDVIIVATAAADDDEQNLIDAIITTTRALNARPPG